MRKGGRRKTNKSKVDKQLLYVEILVDLRYIARLPQNSTFSTSLRVHVGSAALRCPPPSPPPSQPAAAPTARKSGEKNAHPFFFFGGFLSHPRLDPAKRQLSAVQMRVDRPSQSGFLFFLKLALERRGEVGSCQKERKEGNLFFARGGIKDFMFFSLWSR